MIRLKQKKKKKYKQLLCSVVLLALTLFVFGFAADRIRLSNESEQTTILEKAVTRTIRAVIHLTLLISPHIMV